VAFVIAFGCEGRGSLFCSLDSTASVAGLEVARKHLNCFFFCWKHVRCPSKIVAGKANSAQMTDF
jgi:hypothetical protein